MPERIKPTYSFGPCRLDLEGVQGIAGLVQQSFPDALFTARHDTWEIYDEPMDSFVTTISKRQILDSILIVAESAAPARTLVVSFGEEQAEVVFVAGPNHERWFEHFIIDVKKHIQGPTFSQVIAHQRNGAMSVPFIVSLFVPFTAPYAKIIIQEKPRSEFLEAIKANLVSNLIWMLLGSVITLVAGLIISSLR